MNQKIKLHSITILGIVIGGLAGFLYWKFVGCQSGTCPITSSPVNSTLWGVVLGGLLFNSFEKKKEK